MHESSASAVPADEEGRFRVRVCLRRLFSDERARIFLLASPRRRVAWLERRVRRVAGIRGARPLRLVSDGHLLPPGESLALLKHDDLVEVIPAAEDNLVEESPASTLRQNGLNMETSHEVDIKNGGEDRERVGKEDHLDQHLSTSSAEGEELLASKRRALRLLEEYGLGPDAPPEGEVPPEVQAPSESEVPGGAARRRRVRRRNRPDNSVDGGGGRAPRLVRAISPPN